MFLISIHGKKGAFSLFVKSFQQWSEKTRKREFKFSSKNYEKYIKMFAEKCSFQSYQHFFLYYIPDLFNKSLINTFLFVSV